MGLEPGGKAKLTSGPGAAERCEIADGIANAEVPERIRGVIVGPNTAV
jgi:hypothetical protein